MNCPCGSGNAYEACCGPLHDGQARAETSLALMRSRYAAYVKGNIGYLVDTHDPERIGEFDRVNAAQWASRSDWRRLDIVSTQRGKAEDERGRVEFIAWFIADGGLTCHHEVSDFRKVDGKWVYVSGTGRAAESIFAAMGRNDACPCGSGRKFKKCHGG